MSDENGSAACSLLVDTNCKRSQVSSYVEYLRGFICGGNLYYYRQMSPIIIDR